VKTFFAGIGFATLVGAAAASVQGCSSDSKSDASAAGAPLFATNCSSCHGPKAAGQIGPNITGSTSAGIGSWTAAQFMTAVRTGVDDEGEQLCSTMPKFATSDLSDANLAAIHDYLLTLMSDTENPGTGCP
jgi:mono/diheme cytochrome c family protein